MRSKVDDEGVRYIRMRDKYNRRYFISVSIYGNIVKIYRDKM
jgi:hypothetical protein